MQSITYLPGNVFFLNFNIVLREVKWKTMSFFLLIKVKQFQSDNSLSGEALLLLDNAPSHPPEEELIDKTEKN